MSSTYASSQPAGFVNRVEKVAIVGAGGNLGGYFVNALLKTGKHNITALTRPGSTTKLPEGVHSVAVDYDDAASLTAALTGQQFLIITLGVTAPRDTQSKLIRAAAAARVPYIMPNVYGPDPLNERLMADVPVGGAVAPALREIEALGVSKWVVLGCGFWFEWALLGGPDRCGVDVDAHEVTFFDRGEARVAMSTWAQCGRAVAALLSLKRFPDDAGDRAPALDAWANKAVWVSSFVVTQKELFASVLRATGTSEKDWTVKHVASEDRFKEAAERLKTGDLKAFQRLYYTRVFFPTDDGDHTRHGLANDALGLREESLDEATKAAFELLKHRRLTY